MYKQALSQASKSVELFPDWPLPHLLIGYCALKLADPLQALRSMRKLVQLEKRWCSHAGADEDFQNDDDDDAEDVPGREDDEEGEDDDAIGESDGDHVGNEYAQIRDDAAWEESKSNQRVNDGQQDQSCSGVVDTQTTTTSSSITTTTSSSTSSQARSCLLQGYSAWLRRAEKELKINPFAYLQIMDPGPVREMLRRILDGKAQGCPVTDVDFDREQIGLSGLRDMSEVR